MSYTIIKYGIFIINLIFKFKYVVHYDFINFFFMFNLKLHHAPPSTYLSHLTEKSLT